MKQRSNFLFIDVAGHRLAATAYNEGAPGVPVIFLHGVLTSVRFARHVLGPVFGPNRPWFSVSLPAHFPSQVPGGFSAAQVNPDFFADVTAAAVRRLAGDRPAVVAGHSTGGFAALNLAIRRPAMVHGVLSLAGFAVGKWGGLEGLLQQLARGGPPGRALFDLSMWLATRSEPAYRWLSSTLAGDPGAYLRYPGLREAFGEAVEDARRHNFGALAHLLRAIRELDVSADVGSIRAPTLLLAGDRDPVVSFRHSRELAARIPGARLVPFKGAGHMMFFERPQSFRQVVTSWLDEVTGALPVLDRARAHVEARP
ncbi:MAG TPA: alpha/beta hydrolase [Polyangiaceae bacterium]|nr:alpha/beta hydrolase [Polyangiaceae bacterium]